MKSTETKKKRMTQYLKFGNLEMSLGNSKLGDNTVIFNMGSATDCPSRALGLCKIKDNCYALDDEIRYKTPCYYRRRQQAYWLSNSAYDIGLDMINALRSVRKRVDGKLVPLLDTIKYLRFNEAGDFHTQACVTKLDIIASMLAYYNITTYGYTARADLDFTQCNFNVKGSGHGAGNNGWTIAHKMSDKTAKALRFKKIDIDGASFRVCPGDCTVCGMCKNNRKINVVFPLRIKRKKTA